MRRNFPLTAIAFAILAQCGSFPQLPTDPRFTSTASLPPRLLPVGPLLDGLEADQAQDEATRILARAAGLKGKARALRGAVLTPRERRILRRAIARHAR